MNTRSGSCFLLALLATIASSCSEVETPPIREFNEAWESVDCASFDLPPLVAALSDCGYVTVPEYHRQPNGNTIQLAVVRTRSIGEDPVEDPLLLGQGGPGDSAINVFAGKAIQGGSQLLELLKRRDLVTIAQRGTEFSRPHLTCPEQTAHKIAVEKGDRSSEDTAWIVACPDRLLSEGVNFSAFNTVENAADFYFVAETLGYDQFNYYGGSYGTLLGQYIIAQAEEHTAKLRSVIIDGVVPPDVDFNLAVDRTFSQALRNLFAGCRQDQECNQAYPDLEAVFLRTVDRLNQTPIPVTLTVPDTGEAIATRLDGDDFMAAVFGSFYSTATLPSVPMHIYQVANGDYDWVVENSAGDLAQPAPGSEATAMHNAILCTRQNSIQVKPETLLSDPYPQLAYLGPESSMEVTRFCDVLQVETEPRFIAEKTDIPTLIFNGEYDPITPQPYGEVVASNLETPYIYTFAGVGHISLIHRPQVSDADDCAGAIARDFLAHPNRPPDSRCIDSLKPQFEINR